MTRRVSILGSTGSIGRSALDVVRAHRDLFSVEILAAHSNVERLSEQILEFGPSHVVMVDEESARALRERHPSVDVHDGINALGEVASLKVDCVLCAVVGAVGLNPLLAAIDAGNRVAIANKEPLVMAGQFVMERARRSGAEVLPVDSEHNAIFQCLQGHAKEDVHLVHLTASGGPFYGRTLESLRDVTPEQAAKHPTWNMGAKISVDSATLMNKGLELIEAMWLFDLPEDKINIVIHPQSIMHSLVEFTDGSLLAQMGITDMKFPILFALAWPERLESAFGRLDLTRLRDITFAAPDFRNFPCLGLAREAARQGGTATALLNAANECAVEAFCARRVGFTAIADVVERTLNQCASSADYRLEAVMAADAAARAAAGEIIAGLERS